MPMFTLGTLLAAVMETYAATFTARLVTVTPAGEAVRTRHGLTVLPRAAITTAAAERPLFPAALSATPYGAFQRALDDFAHIGGRSIARFAAKRLELRGGSLTTPTQPNNHARSFR